MKKVSNGRTTTNPRTRYSRTADSRIQSPESNSESHHIDTGEAVASLNICLANLGETPYSQAKRCGKGYSRQKVDKLTEALKWTGIASKTVNGDRKEMIEQLKDETIPLTKVSSYKSYTVLPKSWSVKKIQEEFCVTNYMARQSKTLVKEKGILSLPNPKCGPSLSPQTVETTSL